jgi:sulfite exporter TauE/SafE
MIGTIAIAFLIGLQASLHCVGMCGPLALAAPIDQSNQHKAVWGAFKYNLGRISSYTYLGFLVGLIGLQNWMLGAIQWISIATGSIMILSIFLGSMETWFGFRKLSGYVGKAISSRFSSVKKAPAALRPFLFGMLNGFLPCGMVYTAVLFSLGAANLMETILSMLFFGLGTLPIMFFIPLMGQQKLLAYFPRYTQKVLLLIIGLFLILRGLGLGIPYLSPHMDIEQQHGQPTVIHCD